MRLAKKMNLRQIRLQQQRLPGDFYVLCLEKQAKAYQGNTGLIWKV